MRYALFATGSSGISKNIFKDGRTYKHKHSARNMMEQMQELLDEQIEIKEVPEEVNTEKEMSKIEEINLERIERIEVSQIGNSIDIKAGDLKELLFRVNSDTIISMPTSFFYRALVDFGVQVKGFHPSKTALRTYGLSVEEVNKILPGSFKEK